MHLARVCFAAPLALVLAHCAAPSSDEPQTGTTQSALCEAGFLAHFTQANANEWWVEYYITGDTIASAYLEVPGRTNVTLEKRYDKWAAATAKIPSGTMVVLHATNSAGESAQSVSFAYLENTAPAFDPCLAPPPHPTAGQCSASFEPTFTQGSGANEWWVEYALTNTDQQISAVSLVLSDGTAVSLQPYYEKWRGSPPVRIPTGSAVTVHALDYASNTTQTAPFPYLVDTTIASQPCE